MMHSNKNSTRWRGIFGVSGFVCKPNFVYSFCKEEAIIYLGQASLQGSRPALPVNCELPNLLLHQNGFTTPSCHHAAR